MRLLLILPLVSLVSCSSYYSDIPNNDPSYLPAEEYVQIGQVHIKKVYPEFKLATKESVILNYFMFMNNPQPKIKYNAFCEL